MLPWWRFGPPTQVAAGLVPITLWPYDEVGRRAGAEKGGRKS